MQEESKTNAGSVEAIQEHPDDSNKVRTQISDAVILLQIVMMSPGTHLEKSCLYVTRQLSQDTLQNFILQYTEIKIVLLF